MTTIRRAELKDLESITTIYNEAIVKTVATFDTEPKTPQQQQQWFALHGERYPILVAEQNSVVVGWASISSWSDRCAYRDTGETSFYVDETHQGEGIGRQLLQGLCDEATRLGFHSLLARMAEHSDASAYLHRQLGFELVGRLKEVGRKFGELLDVEIYQKMLAPLR